MELALDRDRIRERWLLRHSADVAQAGADTMHVNHVVIINKPSFTTQFDLSIPQS